MPRRLISHFFVLLLTCANVALAEPRPALPGDAVAKLVAAATQQIGVTTIYDPAFVKLAYPGGDLPRERGVCTDVVVRAYRDAFGIDLQRLVHEDMATSFKSYPKTWGLKGPDASIDHRRVLNLKVFFKRKGRELVVTSNGTDYAAGDLVTQQLPGNLPHIAIVSETKSADGARPLVIHNIGAGTRVDDTLFAYPITGHYRFGPTDRP